MFNLVFFKYFFTSELTLLFFFKTTRSAEQLSRTSKLDDSLKFLRNLESIDVMSSEKLSNIFALFLKRDTS